MSDTKELRRIALEVRGELALGEWPPPMGWQAMHAALTLWRAEGEFIFRLRDEYPPALPADLPLLTAPVRREACCYVSRRKWWMIVARVPTGRIFRIESGTERSYQFSGPALAWATEFAEEDRWSGGVIDLQATRTPRELRLRGGEDLVEGRVLERAELADEGVRLAQCLPWFYAAASAGPARA